MRYVLATALGAAVALGASALGAQALPLGQAPGPAALVDHVADGCGPGSFRGPRGFCRPMGGRFFAGPPRRRFYDQRPRGRRFDEPRFYGPRF